MIIPTEETEEVNKDKDMVTVTLHKDILEGMLYGITFIMFSEHPTCRNYLQRMMAKYPRPKDHSDLALPAERALKDVLTQKEQVEYYSRQLNLLLNPELKV